MVRNALVDLGDPRLEPFLGLRDHTARRRREMPGGDMASLFMAEGDRVIMRGLDAGYQLQSVLVDARRRDPLPDQIASADVLAASPEVLTAVCGRPKLRDPIATFVRPPPLHVGEILDASRTVAILEGVVNPTNVGVIVRCAAGLGVDAVLVDPTSCDPLYRRAVRVSMGDVFAIRHGRLEALPEGLDVVEAAGFRTVALTPDAGSVDITTVTRDALDRVAIVLGSEGPGLTVETLDRAHIRARIKMEPGVDSINVGSAAAVAFFALRDQA